ncbi:MAG: hypothetical protein ACYTGP_01945 [Planctomycetota bacterium]|jgi:hypothetical protein
MSILSRRAAGLAAAVCLPALLLAAPAAHGQGDLRVTLVGPDFENWESVDHRAYAVGHVTCNQGTEQMQWHPATPNHPVLAQNMFRLKDGRLEQIGQSWVMHQFCALNFSDCALCEPASCFTMGIGCSTEDSAVETGSQLSAGPKYEVDATTGTFVFPSSNPEFTGDTARRLRVDRTDVRADLNPGALWFVEVQQVHYQDAPDDGGLPDNVSHRQVALNGDGAIVGFAAPSQTGKPGITAWNALDGQVRLEEVVLPEEGSFFVASRAYDNGDGTWDYEYAVQNFDVDRAAGAFTVPLPAGTIPSALGFHDVDYHSGEIWDGADWTTEVAGDAVRWETVPHAVNEQANALRWGTLYNFRFTAAAPPGNTAATIDLFKPGTPSTVTVPIAGPIAVCAEDLNDNGVVDFADVLVLIGAWGPCPGCEEDLDGNGSVGFSDVLQVIGAWGPCG